VVRDRVNAIKNREHAPPDAVALPEWTGADGETQPSLFLYPGCRVQAYKTLKRAPWIKGLPKKTPPHFIKNESLRVQACNILFCFSGHGCQQPDRSHDEPDGLDEALLLADGLTLVDDELHALLLQAHPQTNVFCVIDSCHSATTLDLPFTYMPGSCLVYDNTQQHAATPKIACLSGCTDSGVSLDCFDTTLQKYHGALTAALIKLWPNNNAILNIQQHIHINLQAQGIKQVPIRSPKLAQSDWDDSTHTVFTTTHTSNCTAEAAECSCCVQRRSHHVECAMSAAKALASSAMQPLAIDRAALSSDSSTAVILSSRLRICSNLSLRAFTPHT
jgi:hypothetical protein